MIKLLMFKFCSHPLKNPPSLNSCSPNSSGPTPTSATPLALRSGSSLLISDAIHRHTWQPNLRRKNRTTGWFCHRDWSSTIWNTGVTLTVNEWKTGGIWERCLWVLLICISHIFKIMNSRFKQCHYMPHVYFITSSLCHTRLISKQLKQCWEIMAGFSLCLPAGNTSLYGEQQSGLTRGKIKIKIPETNRFKKKRKALNIS